MLFPFQNTSVLQSRISCKIWKQRWSRNLRDIVKPGEDFNIKITLKNLRRDSRYYTVHPYLPDGWTAEYNKTAQSSYLQRPHGETGLATVEMTIRIGENVNPVNQFPIVIQASQHAIPITIPISLLG